MTVMIVSMVGLLSTTCPAADSGGGNVSDTSTATVRETTAAESSERCDIVLLRCLSLENLLLFLLCTPCQVR